MGLASTSVTFDTDNSHISHKTFLRLHTIWNQHIVVSMGSLCGGMERMTNKEASSCIRDLRVTLMDGEAFSITNETIESLSIAISALESIDRIEAKRDALMHELRVLSACPTCIKHCGCNRTDIVTGSEKKCWEWRGVQNGTL